MMRVRKNGFTLVEVMVVVVIISLTFVGIIAGIISTTNYLTETRQKVMALNLAKEGVEIVYNIRNTNWRRWYEQRDACWLNINPLAYGANEAICSGNAWITTGRREIAKVASTDGNYYYTLTGRKDGGDMATERLLTVNLDKFLASLTSAGTGVLKSEYKLNLTGGKWYNDKDVDKVSGHDPLGGEFYRYIAVDGLYRKDNNSAQKINCTKGNESIDATITCGSGAIAKELRFCSVVVYTKPKQGRIQICSVMTNFEE